MTTLAEFMIIAGADNRPPMLEKYMYDSWKSRMELYIENRENGRMILNSVLNGPRVWPTIVEENGTTRTKNMKNFQLQRNSKLTVILKLPTSFFKVPQQSNTMISQVHSSQSYSPMYATPHLSQPQISHSSVPPSHEYQSHMNHQTSYVPQNAYHSPLVSTQPMTEFPQLDSGVTAPVFTQGDDPRFSSTNNQLRTSSNPRTRPPFKTAWLLCNKFKGGKDKVMLELVIR
ncbi:hypothetical protein Tco_0948435, partial [Tanacetum coccineum]